MRLADVGERGRAGRPVAARVARATQARSVRRIASPSSRPCQAVPRTSLVLQQRLVVVDAAVADLVAARLDAPDGAA